MSSLNVEAIYFDLDDTLCGYWDAGRAALAAVFDLHGPGEPSTGELINHWAASFREFMTEVKQAPWVEGYLRSGEATRTEQMRRTLERAGIADLELATLMSASYLRFRNERLALFPDALDVLNALKPRYPLGLITNGPAEVQRLEIEALGIESYFTHFFIEGELGIGKPEAEVFARAAKAVHLKPERILFVGNSFRHDILPAIQSGWKTAWVRRPSDVPPSSGKDAAQPEQKPPDCPSPDFEIRELTELLEILG